MFLICHDGKNGNPVEKMVKMVLFSANSPYFGTPWPACAAPEIWSQFLQWKLLNYGYGHGQHFSD